MAMRMRTTLLLCLVSISAGVIAVSLAIVQDILQKQIRREIVADLDRSVSTFRNIQLQREQMLRRETALLAALPVLKSLMTTYDARTIQDGAADFFGLSGGDLFLLADRDGKVVAFYRRESGRGAADFPATLRDVGGADAEPHYLLAGGALYEAAVQPLYFGTPGTGTRLGYVLLGYAVDRRLADEVSQAASAAVVFAANGRTVASTLDPRGDVEVRNRSAKLLARDHAMGDIWLGREHFLHLSAILSNAPRPTVQLVVLKSYDRASRYATHLNRVLLEWGALLLLLSGALAVALSTTITRPLDRLVAGARALGAGNFEYRLQRAGAREIRELGEAFDLMRCKLRTAREELLAAERLATIGQMASSISHDLRHYLSAVYANAEFLGYDSLNSEERLELLSEVRQGVRDMTDLIASLLLFSRTGEPLQLSCESLPYLAERAVGMVKAHPDAHGVRILLEPMAQIDAWIDARKIERAIYNLLLNACQAARLASGTPEIRIALEETGEQIGVLIVDNGPGVPDTVRASLFEPFVSAGKPSGTGLGLTLAHKIAQEHGGGVGLEESCPGHTVFRLWLGKAKLRRFAETGQRRETSAAIQ